jgi:regulatory protein
MTKYSEIFLQKARNYCAYQERCIDDVKRKLESWKLNEDVVKDIIFKLKKDGYIDEERFARSFAVGKLRNNKWGRNKIFYALSKKNLPELYIQIGLAEIDEDEYINTLKGILSNKKVKASNEYERAQKLVHYAVQKGFQPELVWKVLKDEI